MTSAEQTASEQPIPNPSRATGAKLIWALAIALLGLIQFILFAPAEPFFPPSALDTSWVMTLHWAYLNHLDFGHELIFTHGPWGFICDGYNPRTYPLTLAGWGIFVIAFMAGIERLGRRAIPRVTKRILWVAAVVLLSAQHLSDVRLFGLCWLLLVLHFFADLRAMSLPSLSLIFAVALASLCKSSFGVAAIGAVGLISVDQIRRKRFPRTLLVYVGAVVVFWLAAGQRLGSLPAFVYHSMQFISVYGAALATEVPLEWVHVSLFLVCAVLLLVPVALLKSRNSTRGETAVTIAGMAVAIFLAFKAGYVRHDAGHAPTAGLVLLLVSIFLATAVWPTLRRRASRVMVVAPVVASFLLAWMSLMRWTNYGLPERLFRSVADLPQLGREMLSLITDQRGTAEVYERFLATRAAARLIPSLPKADATVDVYPSAQDVVLARRLNYRPRPIFQSYAACSTALEKINAEFLIGPRAPEYVLFEVSSVNDNYPSLDDALSWPELLTRYDVADASRPLLLLERSAAPRRHNIVPLTQSQAKLGAWTAVPESSNPIWLNLDIRLSALGAIRAALFKPPSLFIEVKTRDGAVNGYHLVADCARGGFLLSPLVANAASFAQLAGSDWRTHLDGKIVSEFRIITNSADGTDPAYQQPCSATFSSLELFPPTPGASAR